MSFEARCHCGAVVVKVDADVPDQAVECNCSHCSIKGLILGAVPGDVTTVSQGQDQLQTYRFNRKVIEHRFCRTCGVQPYARGKGSDGQPMAMINLRAVPGVDFESIEIMPYDGASR